MSHEFQLHKEIDLPATPEEVWEAIATGPGIDSWFMGRSEVEPRRGGRARLAMGGQTTESTVTAWEPGRRFAFRTDTGGEGGFMAFEYLIEGRDQGSTVLRLVQSGVLNDDWETEYEAMKTGWEMYLHTLSAYLTHFPGRTATPVTAIRPMAADRDRAWMVLTRELGLSAAITDGDAVRLTPAGLAPIDGVIDFAASGYLGVRGGDGLYRFVHSGDDRGKAVVLGHHLFRGEADARRAERAWQDWLGRLSFG